MRRSTVRKQNISVDATITKPEKPIEITINRLKISFLIFFVYIILNLLHIGCPIKFITGISCPGCGMTRSIFSIVHLDLNKAFHFHPLFFLVPIMFCLFIFEAFLKPKFVRITWFLLILTFIITYVIRLLFTENDVVSIDISSSIVIKLLHQINVGGFK